MDFFFTILESIVEVSKYNIMVHVNTGSTFDHFSHGRPVSQDWLYLRLPMAMLPALGGLVGAVGYTILHTEW